MTIAATRKCRAAVVAQNISDSGATATWSRRGCASFCAFVRAHLRLELFLRILVRKNISRCERVRACVQKCFRARSCAKTFLDASAYAPASRYFCAFLCAKKTFLDTSAYALPSRIVIAHSHVQKNTFIDASAYAFAFSFFFCLRILSRKKNMPSCKRVRACV